jgi:endonuclease YncB( thermonuclease family)
MQVFIRLLLISVFPVLLACAESDEAAIDSQVETAVAATISSQGNSDQPPVSDGPPQTMVFCPDCQLVDVTGVVDGDTFDSSIGRIRFFGVDTPERGEPCFSEATEFTRLLLGSQVRLQDGPRIEDTYGRRLAYVFDSSGNSIDVQLIAGGFATAWTRDGQHRDTLVGLEESAKSNHAGCLWGAPEEASMSEAEPQIRSFDPIQHLADFIFSREMATTHVFGLANVEGDEVYFPSGRKGMPTKRNTSAWFAEELGYGVWIVETNREIYRVYDYAKLPTRLFP